MGAVLEIASDLRNRIVAAAAASPGAEICGLLMGNAAAVTAIEACRNVAADPSTRFEIDPAALLAAHRRARAGGAAVIGHYHSHPSGLAEPSRCDADAAAPDGSVWLIAAGGDVTAWRAVAEGGHHGRFDLLSLAVLRPVPAAFR